MRRKLTGMLSACLIALASFSLINAQQLSTSAPPAARRAFTIEDLYRLKSESDLQISPDGHNLAFMLTASDLARARRTNEIWMMDERGKQLRRLPTGEGAASSPRFSPNNKFLVYVSAKGGAPNLYAVATGTDEKRLTNFSTGVADPVWSNDSRWIAFTSDVYPECGGNDECNKRIDDRWESGSLKAHSADDLLYRHWTAWSDGKRTHLFIVNLRTDEVRAVTPMDGNGLPFQLGGAPAYDFSPDGKEIVFVSNPDKQLANSTNADLWIMSLTEPNAKPRNITVGNPAFDGSPKYSPDGKYIAFRMQKQPGYESDRFLLALYERATGKITTLTDAFDNWVDDFQWAKDSQSLWFIAPVQGRTPIYRINVATKAITEVLRDGTIDAWQPTHDEKALIYIRRTVGEPSEIYRAELTDGKAGQPFRLSYYNDKLANEVDIRPAEEMWIEGAKKQKIHVFIVKPHDFDRNKKYPLILNIHGGPQSQWTDGFRGDWQVYPGAGYVVAFANPTGSTGYGQAFTSAISGDWGGRVYEDLMKVTDGLEKLDYVDRNRIGAMGWSYGGYMIDWMQGHTTRYKALASMMGIYDLRSFHGATEELWFPSWDLKGEPYTSKEYEKWSPSNFVKNFKTPTLVITGERDYRVPYTQALNFYTDLQKMNVPSRLIVYSNAGHWPSWYEMALYYTAHLEWFNKYLGGDAPPWTTQAFLRNSVFDRKTGERYKN